MLERFETTIMLISEEFIDDDDYYLQMLPRISERKYTVNMWDKIRPGRFIQFSLRVRDVQ